MDVAKWRRYTNGGEMANKGEKMMMKGKEDTKDKYKAGRVVKKIKRYDKRISDNVKAFHVKVTYLTFSTTV